MTEKNLPRVIAINDDLTSITLTFPSEPPLSARMDVAAVEATIVALGLIRSGLLPPIPSTWQRGQLVECERDPAWSIERDQLAGDVVLHLRNPWLGWQHFIGTKAKVREMAVAILEVCDAPAPTMAGTA